MKKFICFIVLIAATLYISLIYNSESFLMLFYMEIVFAVMMTILMHLAVKKTKVLFNINSNMVYLEDSINIDINVEQKSRIPIGIVEVHMDCVNLYTGRKKNMLLRGDAPLIKVGYKPDFTGYYEFRIKKVYVYDYLGILPFSIKDIDKHTGNTIVIPELYDVDFYVENEVAGVASVSADSKNRYSSEQDEISSIRNYRPGDRLRNIHWKLTSKMDDIMVREEESLYNDMFVFFLILDDVKNKRGSSNSAFEKYLQIMASLSNSIIKNGGHHFLSWYDSTEENIVRHRMNSYEDIYEVMKRLAKGYFASDTKRSNVDITSLMQLYEKRYNVNTLGNYMSLDMQLNINVNNEHIAQISPDSPKESLSQVSITV